MRAVLAMVHTRTTVAEIEEFLTRSGVCVGVSRRRIRQAVRMTRQTNRPVRNVVVAEGKRAQAPSRPSLLYRPRKAWTGRRHWNGLFWP